MPFVTWGDLIELGILICSIPSLALHRADTFRNKKK